MRLKEYMIKSFAVDEERLKQLGGSNYWKELFTEFNTHSS